MQILNHWISIWRAISNLSPSSIVDSFAAFLVMADLGLWHPLVLGPDVLREHMLSGILIAFAQLLKCLLVGDVANDDGNLHHKGSLDKASSWN